MASHLSAFVVGYRKRTLNKSVFDLLMCANYNPLVFGDTGMNEYYLHDLLGIAGGKKSCGRNSTSWGT